MSESSLSRAVAILWPFTAEGVTAPVPKDTLRLVLDRVEKLARAEADRIDEQMQRAGGAPESSS